MRSHLNGKVRDSGVKDGSSVPPFLSGVVWGGGVLVLVGFFLVGVLLGGFFLVGGSLLRICVPNQ